MAAARVRCWRSSPAPGALAVRRAAPALGRAARRGRGCSAVGALVDALAAQGREGRDPGARERRRLLAGGRAAAFCARRGARRAASPASRSRPPGPWVVARVLRRARASATGARWTRAARRWRVAVADALGGGHSLRGGARARRRAAPGARPGTSCGGWPPSWPPARRPTSALEALRARARSRAGRRDRGRLPAAAPRGRRPRAPPARLRARDRGAGAARGRAPRRHGAGALHRR